MKESKKEYLKAGDENVRVGVVGSREYSKVWKVKKALRTWKEKFGDRLVVVSGGAYRGADRIVKDLLKNDAEVEDIEYEEFPPRHQNYNEYCLFPKEEFGKEYDTGHYFERNEEIAFRSDYIFAFIPEGVEASGTKDTIEKAKKFDKKIKIIN